MTLVRSHLRLGVAVWLASHLLTFATLVACDCCPMGVGSPATASAEAPCHETAPPPEPHCEQMMQDGASCPMHHGAATPSGAGCAMSAACGAPGAMLQAVLLQPAVPATAVAIAAPLDVPAPSLTDRPSALSLAVPPDAPPPRA